MGDSWTASYTTWLLRQLICGINKHECTEPGIYKTTCRLRPLFVAAGVAAGVSMLGVPRVLPIARNAGVAEFVLIQFFSAAARQPPPRPR